VNQYGTVYYMQSNRGCGKSVQLIKQRLTDAPELIASLPQGRDVDVAYAQVVSPRPARELLITRIYFDQVTCGKRQKWDIYRVDDTEQAPPP
jgi:hypothetical protein